MARARKVPADSMYFRYTNLNPYDRKTGDCLYRAMAGFLDIHWFDAVEELMQFAKKTGYAPNSADGYERYLSAKGIMKCAQPKVRNFDNESGYAKVTIRDFINHHLTRVVDGRRVATHIAKDGKPCNVFVNITHHATVLKWDDSVGSYRVTDLWDCSDEYIRNYWINFKE